MAEQSATAFSAGFASGAIVDVYTTLLVPRLFAPWAELLVNRLGPASGTSVLDVACGPGTVSRVLARRVGPAGRVLGADYSEAMIAVARGHVAIACWAPIDRRTPWNAMQRALVGILPPERLDVIESPFSWPGQDRLRDGLRAAGFDGITITTETSDIVFEGGASHLATLIGATPLAADVAAPDGDSRRRFEANTVREVEPMLDASGAAHGRMESLLAVASA